MKKEQIAYNRGYRITESGIILNKQAKVLNGSIVKEGYLKINIRFYGKTKALFAHRMQAFQKYGNKLYKPGIQTRHLDGDKLNNNWGNIAIGTASENQLDIPEAIRKARSLHAALAIKIYDYAEVCRFHKKTKSYNKTMKMFGISSRGTLHYILNK